MLIANVSKEPNLAFWREHGNAKRVDWGIPEPLVIKTPSFIQPAEVFFVGLAAEVVEISNFKVRKELTVVVVSTVVWIEKPVEIRIGVDQLGMRVNERAGTGPEGRERASIVEDVHVEAVFHVIVAHEAKDIVVNVAEEVHLIRAKSTSPNIMQVMDTYIGLYTPVPVEIPQSWVLVEKTTVPAAHVAVADHPSFSYPDSPKIFQAVHKSSFIDPSRQGPMIGRDDFVVAFGRCEILGGSLFSDQTRRFTWPSNSTLKSSLNGSSLKNIQG